MTDRIERLKERMLGKTHFRFRTERNLSILNEETKDKPFIIRKALALEKLLKEMPVFIQEDELIVGGRTLFGLPEYIREEEKNQIPMQDQILGYGDIFNTAYNLCQDARGYGEFMGVLAGYDRILNSGLNKIKERACLNFKKTVDKNKRNFYQAVEIVCEAAVNFALRYSQEALRLADVAEKKERKEELKKIAEVCQKVPALPASSFQEALQCLLFSHLIIWAEEHFVVPMGRFDQYIYPFYKSDTENKILSEEEAFELLETLWIKLNSDRDKTHGNPSFEGDTGQTLTLGGQTQDGKDATNDLSYLCLEATCQLKMTEPRVMVRAYEKTPEKFIRKCAELMKLQMGFPTICNDEVIIPTLQKAGYSEEDAKDYCPAGCWELSISGKADDRTNSGVVNLPRCLEWTLNNGKNYMDGEKLGLDLCNVEEIRTFDRLFDIFKKEGSYYIKKIVENCNRACFAPAPFLSIMMENCLENGSDLSEGGSKYNNTGLLINGLATAADSLLSIRKIVFEEKKLELSELKEILLSNYKDREDIRQHLMNKIPKYGNENEEADSLTKEVAGYFCEEVSKYKNNRGGCFRPGIYTAGTFVFVGKKLGASPDGRKAGEPFSQNASPALGRDKNGPTAVIHSLTKLNLEKAANGAIVDLKFHPTAVESTEKLSSFLKALLHSGVMQFHANVIDTKVLREAQKHPEQHTNLMVRIWGFSVYFATLCPEFQDHVIARMEHTGC